MTTVVVGGTLANKPRNGGEAWVRLSWALGLARLGYDVYLVEQLSEQTCTDAAGHPAPFEASINRAWFHQVTRAFGLADRCALVCEESDRVEGLGRDELHAVAERADLLVNISGHLRQPDLLRRFPCRAYVDIDPGYTQFWHADGALDGQLAAHDLLFTIGQNIGQRGCDIPTGGLPWRPIRQPVVLDHWPVTSGAPGRFTTVASWRGPFGRITHAGHSFGLKAHEFRRFAALPTRTPDTFELALSIHPADLRNLELLRRHGWQVIDPGTVAGDPNSFRDYVTASSAEFSVAQGIYAETGSGWFSDRTVRYLAAGRPALVQDTGFSRNLPVGQGLLTFRTLEEAVAGAAAITTNYDLHAKAARTLAESCFDSDRVLTDLLREAGLTR